MMIGAAIAFGLAAVVTIAAAITLLLIEVGVEPWLAAGDHRRGDGPDGLRARAVGHFRAAQEIDRSRRNDSFPQGDDPVAQERIDSLTRVGATRETDGDPRARSSGPASR